MGLFNMIMGNATTLNPEEIQKEFSEILIDGEKIDSAFKVIRDKWVFTNCTSLEKVEWIYTLTLRLIEWSQG